MELMQPRALEVDDDPVTHGYVSDLLSAAGYEAYACADGREALAFFLQHAPFSVLIVDVCLPGMQGPEVVALLSRASADLRMLFISARPRSPILGQGCGFLAKPFSETALLGEIARLAETAPGSA
ncbi:MAG: response regulator transcription factor [Myxococcota bacterium]